MRNFLYRHPFLFNTVCRLRAMMYAYGIMDFVSRFSRCRLLFRGLSVLMFLLFAPFAGILHLIHRRKIRRIREADEQAQYPHEWAAVIMVKDEAPYMAEWVAYYKLMGVTRFYIYDNDSSDNLAEELQSFINEGLVELIHWPGPIMQVKAFTDGAMRCRNEARWVSFLDADEFMVPANPHACIPDIVREVMKKDPHAAGVAVPWLMFGSNHHETMPDGLVIESYTGRAEESYTLNIKTIANPRLIHSFYSPHYPCYLYGAYNINENGQRVYASFDYNKSMTLLRIHHYFTKSKEECMKKIAKGIATVGRRRTEAIFYERDRNGVQDDSMLRYADAVKKILGRAK